MAIVGTTQLKLYKAALLECGDYIISSLTENVEARRVIDEVYDRVLEQCLSEGPWNFATRTVKLDADTGIVPNFGFTEIFSKPTDWLRTIGVSADDRWTAPLVDYNDDVSYWAADITPIYVRYISNSTSFGLDLTNWPTKFTRYVELSLAHRILPRLSQDKQAKERIMRDMRIARREALAIDALNEAQPKFFPTSSWTLARGSSAGRRDRGSRTSLTG